MQAAGFIVNTSIASANAWNDGITHTKYYVQQETEKKNILETLEMVVGHRGCCHEDSGKNEPMAALLS